MNGEQRMSCMHIMTIRRGRPLLARRPLSGTFAAAFLASVLALAACEGDNLFSDGASGRASAGPPVIASIDAPASIDEGQRLDVRIKAIAPAGMQQVVVRFRRALNDDQTFAFDGTRVDTVTVDASVTIPRPALDSNLIIDVFATDRLGRASAIASATVSITPSGALMSVTVTPAGTVALDHTAVAKTGPIDVAGFAVTSVPISGEQREHSAG